MRKKIEYRINEDSRILENNLIDEEKVKKDGIVMLV